MKTLQDLVDRLNEFNTTRFSISKKCGHAHLEASDSCGVKYRLVYFVDYLYKIRRNFHMLQPYEQKAIIDFLANSNPEDWFAEKKYNIVLNNLEGEKIVINKYDRHSTLAIECSTGIDDDELKLDAYIFTEKEIEQLKLTLPTNMAKIVDLGKVEVKDEIA